MDSIENNVKNVGFFKHVFNFDEDSQAEMFNIIQYGILAVIPVIALNKIVQSIIPIADDNKGSFEVSAEIIFQVIIMFIGILIIHKIITYIPTYSKISYATFNVTNIILAFLVIVLSLQTKLGEKSNLLYERVSNSIEGKTNLKESLTTQNVVEGMAHKSIPNISGTGSHQNDSQQHISNNIQHIVPSNLGGGGPPPTLQHIQPNSTQGPTQQHPTGNAAPQGNGMGGELMAANEALGGAFGSLF
jgi:hypothetical protein